jgi:hypothetical protein
VKIEGGMFAGGAIFYLVVTLAYAYVTNVTQGGVEVVGTTVLLLTALLAAIIGFYVLYTAKRVGIRPEDRFDAEIDEADPDYGFYSPHSWWPLPIGLGACLTAVGLAFTVWLLILGVGVLMFGVIGLVFEYSVGDGGH